MLRTACLLSLTLLAACGAPDRQGATVQRLDVRSRSVHRSLEQLVVRPPRGGDRLLLVFLHGRTDDLDGPRSVLSDELFAALRQLGESAPTVLLANGGERSYWHDRRGGRWARYLLREVVPRVRAPGQRVAIAGISMGGYGALHLAGAPAAPRFCAVGAHSPALWQAAGDTAPGAFDDAQDWLRNGRPGRPAAPVFVDVGTRDPFRAAVQAYGRRTGTRVRVWPGGHDGRYWRAHVGTYLRFAVRACSGG